MSYLYLYLNIRTRSCDPTSAPKSPIARAPGCIIKKIVVMWDSNPPVYHNDLIQVNNRVLKHQNVGYEHYIHWDWDLGLLLFHSNTSINKNLTIVTAIAIPNTTNNSIFLNLFIPQYTKAP